MDQKLVPGLVGEAVTRVTPENTADGMAHSGVKVFATPMLVALMETAAARAVQPYLADGETTVGTRVDIAHLAATPEGMTVRAVAELQDVSGKRLAYKVEAFDDREKVGEGWHERYIINTEKFLAKLASKR